MQHPVMTPAKRHVVQAGTCARSWSTGRQDVLRRSLYGILIPYAVAANGSIKFTGPLASANGKVLPGSRIGLNMNGGNFFNTTCSRSRSFIC